MEGLLGLTGSVSSKRSQFHDLDGVPVMVTYHPSYLLRGYNPEGKRQAFEDLKEVLTYVYK